jgi:hypothetical protein
MKSIHQKKLRLEPKVLQMKRTFYTECVFLELLSPIDSRYLMFNNHGRQDFKNMSEIPDLFTLLGRLVSCSKMIYFRCKIIATINNRFFPLLTHIIQI